MSDESLFERSLLPPQDVLAAHQARLARLDTLAAQHAEHLARLDRNYEKLLAIAADVAATNDKLEDQSRRTGQREGDILSKFDAYITRQDGINDRLTSAIERLEALMTEVFRERYNGRTA